MVRPWLPVIRDRCNGLHQSMGPQVDSLAHVN
jgi:hypothetical protein